MDNIKKIFKQLGASDIEFTIYILLLQGGRQSITTIARRLKKPRTSLYTHVEKLEQKGLLLVEQASKGKRYNALSYDELVLFIEGRKQNLNNSLENLMNARETYENMQLHSAILPKVKIYETKEARNIVYKRLQNFKEAFSIFNYDAALQAFKWNQKRRKQVGSVPKGAIVREILIDSKEARKYKKHREKENKGRHFIKLRDVTKMGKMSSDLLLIDGVFFHTSISEKIIMIEVNDPIFYETQKTIFHQLRQMLP